MEKPIIVLKHDEYKSLNEFLTGLEDAIVNGKHSDYAVIISGQVDPFINPVFYRDGYTTMIKMAEVAKHLKARITVQINTRMPITVSQKQIRDIFHIYPVGINYYISNNDFERDTKLVPVQEAVKKLETWDGKHPMKTKIVVDIDEYIHNVRRESIIKAIHNTYIGVMVEDYAQFRITKSNEDKIKVILQS
jgi:hypothetical protein